jgi:hypothetical protein
VRRGAKRFADALHSELAEGSLDGYQRRKYLAKIIFTYILGYNVEFGHMEAVNLIASAKYSEKQIVSRRATSREEES